MITDRICDVDYAFEYMTEHGIATPGELALITAINGYNLKSLNDVLYVRTGYSDINAYIEDEDALVERAYEEYRDRLEEEDAQRGCADCPDDECTGHCMSCYYRPI